MHRHSDLMGLELNLGIKSFKGRPMVYIPSPELCKYDRLLGKGTIRKPVELKMLINSPYSREISLDDPGGPNVTPLTEETQGKRASVTIT